jgi:hypothetical protein
MLMFYRFAVYNEKTGFTALVPGAGLWGNPVDFWYGVGVVKNLLNIHSQMSLVQLANGRFVVLGAAALTPMTEKQLLHMLQVKDSGESLADAVVATHPFHTLAFPALRRLLPTVPFYGTPRHLRLQPQIRWAGLVTDRSLRLRWEPELSMRVCGARAGVEFHNPVPPESNHVASLLVFHARSRTLVVDDTISFHLDPGALLRLRGWVPGQPRFHSSLPGAFLKQANAPELFTAFIQGLLRDWDFNNLACAHSHPMLGGAKDAVRAALERAQPMFAAFSEATASASQVRRQSREQAADARHERTLRAASTSTASSSSGSPPVVVAHASTGTGRRSVVASVELDSQRSADPACALLGRPEGAGALSCTECG